MTAGADRPEPVSFFRKLLIFFGIGAKPAALPAASAAPPPEAVRPFLKRHRAELARLGIVPTATGFAYSETRAHADRGVQTELLADTLSPYSPDELARPELRQADAARAWIVKKREELVFQTRFALNQADSAIKALTDFVLRPGDLRWLGGEDVARAKYLQLPPSMPAQRAATSARNLIREAQAEVSKARSAFLAARLKTFTAARLNGKTLHAAYTDTLPLLAASLSLEINVDKVLDHRESERLVDVPEAELSAAVDALLQAPRQALVARVAEQLDDLTRRLKSLPHVELLTDAEIAETVAPYYGGISRSLKRRRAKSAFVAIEERAREAKYQDDVVKLNEKRDAFADVASYYPLARKLKRQLILYTGPTNSGKTWRSLNDLVAAGSGVYLAPLRLLALEGQEELEKRGKTTSFITGEERDIRPDATFISSTIEMLNLETEVEAVVIDEVQLLADERRGWAWLAAVVGAAAKRVIMTGSVDCVELVKELATYLGEELTIVECQRHNELRVAPAPMRLREVRPGMAVICFSRRDVLRLKTLIQENTQQKVAVIYGNLSPQVRREEARRFRTGEAEILIATDAIAMGLNLPISEVLFYTTEKFNGEEMVELSASDIRQIGGRAGRYGFAQFGVVNALTEDSLDLIREAIQGTAETLKPPFYVAPGHNHIRIISEVLGSNSLERILTFFDRAIEFSDERFARSNIDELSYLSTFVDERLPFMDLTQRLNIACAPVPIRNETVLHWFLNRMLACFPDPEEPEVETDHLDDLFAAANHFAGRTARSQMELRDAEDYLKTLTVYAWLAYRYPEVFLRIEACEEQREVVNAFIESSLRRTPTKKEPGEGEAEKPKRSGRRRSGGGGGGGKRRR